MGQALNRLNLSPRFLPWGPRREGVGILLSLLLPFDLDRRPHCPTCPSLTQEGTDAAGTNGFRGLVSVSLLIRNYWLQAIANPIKAAAAALKAFAYACSKSRRGWRSDVTRDGVSLCPSLCSMVLFSLTLYLQEWPHGLNMAAEYPVITTAFKGRNC